MTMSPEDQLREIGIDHIHDGMSADEMLAGYIGNVEIVDDGMDVDLAIARHANDLAFLRGRDQGEFIADMAYMKGLSSAMFEHGAHKRQEPEFLSVEMQLAMSLTPDVYDQVFGEWEE